MHGLRICLNFHLFFFFVCALICNLTYFRNYKEVVSLCIKKSIDSNFLFFMKFCACCQCDALAVLLCKLAVVFLKYLSKVHFCLFFCLFFFPPSPSSSFHSPATVSAQLLYQVSICSFIFCLAA